MLRPIQAATCNLYIASPFGFSEAGRHFYHEKLLPLLKREGFKILDPWNTAYGPEMERLQAMPYGEQRRKTWEELNAVLGKQNEQLIRSSNGIVAVLDGVDVDSGTASEIGFGYGLSLPILGYRGDFRRTGDNEGSLVNLQVEHFIRNSGGTIVESLEDLKKSLPRVFLAQPSSL